MSLSIQKSIQILLNNTLRDAAGKSSLKRQVASAPLLNLSDATAGRVSSTVEVTLRLGLQEKLNARERLKIDSFYRST
jgi:hypothetical protein